LPIRSASCTLCIYADKKEIAMLTFGSRPLLLLRIVALTLSGYCAVATAHSELNLLLSQNQMALFQLTKTGRASLTSPELIAGRSAGPIRSNDSTGSSKKHKVGHSRHRKPVQVELLRPDGRRQEFSAFRLRSDQRRKIRLQAIEIE
jgi:hypothetical protein